MGVFDPNQSARNYASTAHGQAAQKAQKDFHRHNQEYARRTASLTGAARSGRRARKTTADGAGNIAPAAPRFPGDDDYTEAAPKRRRGLAGWVVAAAAAAALAFASVAFTGWPVLPDNPLSTTHDVHATVRPGTEWNVRGGPSMSSKPVAVVRPGQEISVACMEGNWAKVTTPVRGFVYRAGLDLSATPRPC